MLGIEPDDITLPEDWGYPRGAGPVVVGLGIRAMTKAKRPQSVSFLEENERGLAEGLRLLRLATPAGARLFPVSLACYRTLIKDVQAQYSLDVGWGPHSPRAGFASESAALGVPFETIRETGRWRVDSSLRIYIDVVQASQVGTALRAAGLQPALDWATRRWFAQVRAGLDGGPSTGHSQASGPRPRAPPRAGGSTGHAGLGGQLAVHPQLAGHPSSASAGHAAPPPRGHAAAGGWLGDGPVRDPSGSDLAGRGAFTAAQRPSSGQGCRIA